MTAGHCCAAGATKAICGGKERPGIKLAESVAMFTNNAGQNDFCLLHLDQPVTNLPIYEVAVPDDVFAREDAIIVGCASLCKRACSPPRVEVTEGDRGARGVEGKNACAAGRRGAESGSPDALGGGSPQTA